MDNFQGERGAFGEVMKPHSRHSLSDDPSDLDNCSLIHHQITWFATSPISVVGVVMNIVVLLVWSVRKRYQTIIFLFKVLAVMDLTYILTFNVWWYSPRESLFADIMSYFMYVGQYMLVNVTVLISVWRWISVFRHEHSRKLQTKFRARLAVGIVMSYCTVVVLVKQVVAYGMDDEHAIAIMSVVIANMLLSVPLILLALLTASLVWALQKTAKDKVNPELSSTGHIHFHGHSPNARSKVRRLNFCIICVAVSTFIAYPLAGAVTAYFKLASNPDYICAQKTAFAVSYFLYIVNSTIPFFLYFSFMIKFRKLFLLKFITFYLGNYSTTMASDTEGQSETGVHSNVADCPNKFQHQQHSYRHSLVVVTEDGTLTISKARTSSREEGKTSSTPPTTKWNRASR